MLYELLLSGNTILALRVKFASMEAVTNSSRFVSAVPTVFPRKRLMDNVGMCGDVAVLYLSHTVFEHITTKDGKHNFNQR